MKRLYIITFAITLLLSQWGTIDHVYHEHTAGEVCDYCLSAPSLDNALSYNHNIDFSKNTVQSHNEITLELLITSTVRIYAARAPPRLV